ncbi:olfactory receptor 51G2-like [Pelodiscus sinensis]|uniref:olfactory receptor 51G2-like n=1 Tax=Pelodiscus sinensis TaxID=13735 RepID=UPI0003C43144|nr:olfactory receptor 51G2-like [Pelodiscus sinensis]|eukprot:XP_006132499.1 olfactory receptor 51G2-like [Pelodiscus sinensis]
MSDVNDTEFTHVMFLLSAIPGQEDFHLWISIAFGLVYAIAIVGNSVILVIIKTEPSLHEPMYIFLSMLALTDLGFLIATMPTTLGLYFFNFREINLHACIFQMYFVSVLLFTESGVLLSMAFDRFIAISNPLRYSSILTRPRIATMGLVSVIRALTVLIPFPVFLRQFQYCRSNVLTHSYCRNEDILKLACSDVGLRGMYGMIIKILTMGLDLPLIFFSYVMILKTVLSITSRVESLRALNTCVSHFCAVLLLYTPEFSLSVITRFVKDASPLLRILLNYVSLLVPPLMNPIVYSVKSKPLRERIIKVFTM